LKIFFWVLRISFLISIIVTAAQGMTLFGDYKSDVVLADSAAQATQLSNEYILRALSHLTFIITEGILYLVFEIALNTYYLKINKQSERKSEVEKAEQEKKEQAQEKKEKEEREDLIVISKGIGDAMDTASEKEREDLIIIFKGIEDAMAKMSEGVISDVTISKETSYFHVNVFVDDSTWANLNESQKLSFATKASTTIESNLSSYATIVEIRSTKNKDVVVEQKMFGGWKIKR
jgi:hypothetical protein